MSRPDNNERAVPNRRTFLKTAGTLAVAGSVAGCISGGDGGDGGSGGDGGDGGSGGSGGGATTSGGGSDYPTDDITFIVPYSTGGGFDAYARLMAPYLEEELGTTVNVKNVTGGGGVVGATQVYNAEPDGHTITIWAPKEAAYKQIGLDVEFDIREFSHVGYVTQDPNQVTLKSDLGIDTWDQFVNAIPDLNFVTQGRGSSAHMLTVLLGGMTGAFAPESVNFVHYAGTGAALGGLESGEGNAFTVGTASSAAKVVNSLPMEMFLMFCGPDHSIAEYLSANDVEVENWSTELDVNNMQKYNDLTVFRRFVTGPPGVPEEIKQKQIAAFESIVNNEQFTQEARDAARPIINPAAGAEPVSQAIDSTFQSLNQEPYKGMIKDAFSG